MSGGPWSVRENLGRFGEAEFELDAVGVKKLAPVVLSEAEVERGIGKDAAGGVELKVEMGEVPSAKEKDDAGEKKARSAEGDEDAIDQEKPRDAERDGGSEKGSSARVHGHRREFE